MHKPNTSWHNPYPTLPTMMQELNNAGAPEQKWRNIVVLMSWICALAFLIQFVMAQIKVNVTRV
jgi:hypothetical protein